MESGVDGPHDQAASYGVVHDHARSVGGVSLIAGMPDSFAEPTAAERGKPSRVLVTGCAGFIGSHLTESLLRDGVRVTGVDCFNANYGRDQKRANLRHAMDWDGFEFVPLDLATGDLREFVEGVDTVFHLAAEPGVRSSWGDRFQRYVTNNLVATQQLLNAMRESPGARLVYASSSSIYGDAEQLPTHEATIPRPVSPYGMTKLSGEHLCNLYASNFGMEVVSLRYFTVFGPRQRPDMAFNIFSRAAVAGEPISIHGDGRQTRDFTYVADIVAATRAAGERAVESGGAYNVGGGLRASIRDVLGDLAEISGRKLDVSYGAEQAGDVRDTGADVEKARRHLGFAPSVPLRDGLAAEYQWVLEQAGHAV